MFVTASPLLVVTSACHRVCGPWSEIRSREGQTQHRQSGTAQGNWVRSDGQIVAVTGLNSFHDIVLKAPRELGSFGAFSISLRVRNRVLPLMPPSEGAFRPRPTWHDIVLHSCKEPWVIRQGVSSDASMRPPPREITILSSSCEGLMKVGFEPQNSFLGGAKK